MDIDYSAEVRCPSLSRNIPLGDCLDDFKEDAVNLRVRGAVAGRCSRCSDGRQRRMLVAEGRMPLRAGEARPRPATPAPAAPATTPASPPDCDDGKPCTVEAVATPPTAAPTTTATTETRAPATDPALLDVLRDIACGLRGLRVSLDAAAVARAERGDVWELRRVTSNGCVVAVTAGGPTPAPPATTATPARTTTATTPATRARKGHKKRQPGYIPGLDANVRADSESSRLLLTIAAAPDGVADVRPLIREAGARGVPHNRLHTAAHDHMRRGTLERVSHGVYRVTDKGRTIAAAIRAAAGGAP